MRYQRNLYTAEKRV